MRSRPSARSFGRPSVCVVAALVAVTAAGCSGSDSPVPASTGSVAATTTTQHPDDGTLVIGAVLPSSGSSADLGASMGDALTAALTEINAAGGINGRPVRLLTREEGDNPATAGLAVQELSPLVDAIIGPTSSLNTLGTLGATVDAGVLSCSPTATALALDDFPDNGLFFRTIPSDSLEAVAMANVVESSGGSTAMIVYIDDAFGRPFAAAAQEAIAAEGTRVALSIGFTPNEDSITATVAAVEKVKPDIIAVIADGTTGPTIINAIDAGTSTRLTFVVNDAVRRPAASAQPFSANLGRRIVGVSPLAYADSLQFTQELTTVNPITTGLYAHNAYDCLSVIALAAQAAGSDQPAEIAAAIPGVTNSGTSCTTFTACAAALAEGRNINYNGPTGTLAIGTSGEVIAATFERFTFDDTGRDISDGTIAVGV